MTRRGLVFLLAAGFAWPRAINLKTATALCVTVQRKVVMRVDRAIE